MYTRARTKLIDGLGHAMWSVTTEEDGQNLHDAYNRISIANGLALMLSQYARSSFVPLKKEWACQVAKINVKALTSGDGKLA